MFYRRGPQELALVQRLKRENEALRAEVRKLETYRGLAYHDDLTQLHNRRYFDERLSQEIARARRWRWSLSVILLDLDDFKHVNDAHGHAVGDEVLEWFGGFLPGAIREIDVPCRIGGDEFAIILPCTDKEGAVRVFDRVASELEESSPPRGLLVDASLGIATYPNDAATISELVLSADEDMYRTKRQRKLTRRYGT